MFSNEMWIKGQCPVLWDEGYKAFNYVRQPVTGAESDTWRSQGYTHENTTGKMYGNRNPMPYYVEEVAQILNLKNCGFVFYKMDTLDIMPTHVDLYKTYCKVFKKKRNEVRRAIVFLEDWKPGHLIHYQDANKEWQSSTHWKAGDGFIWDSDHLHLSGNCGLEDKYTLQVSGFLQ